ncbi:MAG TPA: hypothetical protein PLZ51_11965, partial [Aggregatilineales bacterium]|nr:hypothetical protein [Aggregatilineales bacterium]
MRMMRLCLWVGLWLLVTPTIAQDETPIDPYGDYTEIYTMDNITVNYPTEMVVRHESHQIILDFSDNYTDTIIIATPAMFDYFGIANRTPEIALRTMYRTLYQIRPAMSAYEIVPRFDAIKQETTLAGLNAMTFTLKYPTWGMIYIAYTFEVRGSVYGVMLTT